MKVFGIVYLKYETGANSPLLDVQEVTPDQIYETDVEFRKWIEECEPGAYYSASGRVVFRIR